MGFFPDDFCVLGILFVCLNDLGRGGCWFVGVLCVSLVGLSVYFFVGRTVSLLHWISKNIFKLSKQEKLT